MSGREDKCRNLRHIAAKVMMAPRKGAIDQNSSPRLVDSGGDSRHISPRRAGLGVAGAGRSNRAPYREALEEV